MRRMSFLLLAIVAGCADPQKRAEEDITAVVTDAMKSVQENHFDHYYELLSTQAKSHMTLQQFKAYAAESGDDWRQSIAGWSIVKIGFNSDERDKGKARLDVASVGLKLPANPSVQGSVLELINEGGEWKLNPPPPLK